MRLQKESRNQIANKANAKEQSVNMADHKGKGNAHAHSPAKPSKEVAVLKAFGPNIMKKGI